jgi:thiol-disulfide isomerase/thioredoxin
MSHHIALPRWIETLLCLTLICAVVPARAHAGDPTTSLPRYKLKVGQQLNYAEGGIFRHENGAHRNDVNVQIIVVGQNDDGSHRLVIRQATALTQIESDGKESKQPEEIEYGYADLDASGKLVERLNSFGSRIEPTPVLIQLPASTDELAKGWQSKTATWDGILHYRKLPESNSEQLILEIVEERPINQIYGIEFLNTATFDLKRGLLEKRVSTWKQSYGFKGQGRAEMKLVDIQTHDAPWCAKFAADAERYFTAQKEFKKVTEVDDGTPESMDKAVAALKATKDGIESPELQHQIDHLLEEFQRYRTSSEEESKDRKALLGQQAEEFKTTDLNDKPHALADYRGKVVVLDFWYRGCGWCIRAMPQLKEVADHYHDNQVVVLGMNTDDEVDDAKFVVEKMSLNYTNLKAVGLPEKFKVHGFPTMIIIDQEGKICDVHVGWSPTLKQDLIEKIDRILAKPK